MENKFKSVFDAMKHKGNKDQNKIKKGDILFCKSPTTSWICIVSHIKDRKVHYYANYNLRAKVLNFNDWFLLEYTARKADADEKDKLDSVLNEVGLKWIASLNRFCQLDDLIRIPYMHSLYKLKGFEKSDKNILIRSDDKTIILLSTDDSYSAVPYEPRIFEKDEFYMFRCEYQDLQFGDTVFRTKDDPKYTLPIFDDNRNYIRKLVQGYVYLDENSIIRSDDENYYWFKIINS